MLGSRRIMKSRLEAGPIPGLEYHEAGSVCKVLATKSLSDSRWARWLAA